MKVVPLVTDIENMVWLAYGVFAAVARDSLALNEFLQVGRHVRLQQQLRLKSHSPRRGFSVVGRAGGDFERINRLQPGFYSGWGGRP